MSEIVNKFLLAGDKFMPKMHLKQPGFTYCAFGPFTKNKQRIQKFKETGDTSYIYKNELDKGILRDKTFNIAKNPKYDGYQRGLASMVYKFFDKKSTGSGIVNNNNNNNNNNNKNNKNNDTKQNLQLAEELHKPIIKKFKKRKVYSRFRDSIWGTDLADMQLISKFNKGFRFLLRVINILSKYTWVIPLKDKKGVTIVDAFQEILKESNRNCNKIWVDKGTEFYNGPFEKWLENNDIKIYSIHNKGKSVVAERFIKTLKDKIYKYMTSVDL